MCMGLIEPFATSNVWYHQDHSLKAHHSRKLSKLIQEVPPTPRSLVRTNCKPAASYLHSTNLYQVPSQSQLGAWYWAALEALPSGTLGPAVNQKLQCRG